MSRARIPLIFCIGMAFLLGAVPASAQRGAMVLQQNLAELVDEAATVVRGQVVSAMVEPHPELQNLDTVVVTLQVERTLKGQTGATFTFRQYFWDIRDRGTAAGYAKGQHLLLLMIKPSEIGLSSPAGLSQGRFQIARGPEGELLAGNGAGNTGLFRGIAPLLQKKGVKLPEHLAQTVAEDRGGPMPLKDLEDIIVALASSSGGQE